MAAHDRLMDGNLFWIVCDGSAGEVEEMIPGHNLTAVSSRNLQAKDGEEERKQVDK